MITIHHNVPLPKAHRWKRDKLTRELLGMIRANTFGLGDMVVLPYEPIQLRQASYQEGFKIAIRFNRKTNRFNVWRTL